MQKPSWQLGESSRRGAGAECAERKAVLLRAPSLPKRMASSGAPRVQENGRLALCRGGRAVLRGGAFESGTEGWQRVEGKSFSEQ